MVSAFDRVCAIGLPIARLVEPTNGESAFGANGGGVLSETYSYCFSSYLADLALERIADSLLLT